MSTLFYFIKLVHTKKKKKKFSRHSSKKVVLYIKDEKDNVFLKPKLHF